MNLLNIDNDSESFSKVDPFKNAALKNYNEFLSTYGLVDLGLPSGTLWSTIDLCHPYASSFPKQELKEIHENHPISTYPWETTKLEDFVLEHIDMYSIPTKQQAAELIHFCIRDTMLVFFIIVRVES